MPLLETRRVRLVTTGDEIFDEPFVVILPESPGLSMDATILRPHCDEFPGKRVADQKKKGGSMGLAPVPWGSRSRPTTRSSSSLAVRLYDMFPAGACTPATSWFAIVILM
jgi:hypothetical protein